MHIQVFLFFIIIIKLKGQSKDKPVMQAPGHMISKQTNLGQDRPVFKPWQLHNNWNAFYSCAC